MGRGSDDYWSEDFDTSKNCLQEKKIIELRDKVSVQHYTYHMVMKYDKVLDVKNCRPMTSGGQIPLPQPSVRVRW